MTAETPRPANTAAWRTRLLPSQVVVLGACAILVGVLSACGIWLFKWLIDVAQSAFFHGPGPALEGVRPWTIVLVPAVGGLVVGLVVHWFVGEERHHGVAGIMEAVALAGGRLRYRCAPAKAVAAALAIGTGASVGPEDPSVQIGANLGSMFGQRLDLSAERVNILVAAGVAAGVAAAFNAPIAGLFFALEVVLGDLGAKAFGSIVLAAVASSVLTQVFTGPRPAFDVPPYALKSVWELPLYLVLGLLAGPVAAILAGVFDRSRDAMAATGLPRWARPALAGLAVGVVGLAVPQVLGVGYVTIDSVLHGSDLAVGMLLAILATKLVMTAVCVGSGMPGGIFAPSLVLGAVLGAAFAQVVRGALPSLGVEVPAYAMVGMAAVLAGCLHAPLTATLLLFELTQNYLILPPLLFAVAVSVFVSKRLQPDSVYALSLAKKGIRLEKGRDVEVLDAIGVAEIMETNPATLRESQSLAKATDVLARSRTHGLPVVDAAGRLVGILTIHDIDRTRNESRRKRAAVGDACTRDLGVTFPDESISAALRVMAERDVGLLPVVARDDSTRLLGVLRRTDLVRAYDVALTRRATSRLRVEEAQLDAHTGATVEEHVVAPDAPCAGKRVVETTWPREFVLASVRRGSRVLIPHGDTVLLPGDVVVAVVGEGEGDGVRRLFRAAEAAGGTRPD